MRSASVVLAVIFVSYAVASPTKTCPENEQFNECGSACEPSCKNPKPFICTLQCIIGCQCKQGFFRNAEGKCVTFDKCPQIAPRNVEDADPCATHKCPKNQKCILRQVQCIRAPCNPIPVCV